MQLLRRCRTDGRSQALRGSCNFSPPLPLLLCRSYPAFSLPSPPLSSPLLSSPLAYNSPSSPAQHAWHRSLKKPQPATAAAVLVVTQQSVKSVGSSAGLPLAGGVMAEPPAWGSMPTPGTKVSNLQHIKVYQIRQQDEGTGCTASADLLASRLDQGRNTEDSRSEDPPVSSQDAAELGACICQAGARVCTWLCRRILWGSWRGVGFSRLCGAVACSKETNMVR